MNNKIQYLKVCVMNCKWYLFNDVLFLGGNNWNRFLNIIASRSINLWIILLCSERKTLTFSLLHIYIRKWKLDMVVLLNLRNKLFLPFVRTRNGTEFYREILTVPNKQHKVLHVLELTLWNLTWFRLFKWKIQKWKVF